MIVISSQIQSGQFVSSGLEQSTETNGMHHSPSTADLFFIGIVLVASILMSRQLIIVLLRRFEFQRTVSLIQHQATLERWLNIQPASKNYLK